MTNPTLAFTKMHGCANDYVVVDAVRQAVSDPAGLARAVADRRTGVGCDGLLLALPSDVADLRMRMFNTDGSEAEMCGNGIRCLVKFAAERGLLPDRPGGQIETGAGVLAYEARLRDRRVTPLVDEVTIRMGRPRLERAEIPMAGPAGRVVDEELPVGDARLVVTAVSMGNPHAVSFVDGVDAYPVETIGPQVERHASFPRRTNAEFVEVLSPNEVRQRTWERGCGETLACGTGACAVVVAGALSGRTARDVVVHLRGGDLRIVWGEDDVVEMTGPAVEVFEGVWPLEGGDR